MWLTVLPIETHGFFALSKSEFGDALCLQYGWRPPYLPDSCTWSHIFTINHAMSCAKGGFSTIRLNELRDVLAGMMSDVCCDVHTEPTLQPLNGEVLPKQTTTSNDESRLDISACGFYQSRFQKTYFDVHVFNPTPESIL